MRLNSLQRAEELSNIYSGVSGGEFSTATSGLHPRPGLTYPGDRGQSHSASERLLMTREYPRNIGILAAELYFPPTFVSQADLGTSWRELSPFLSHPFTSSPRRNP